MATGKDLFNVLAYLQSNGKDPLAGLNSQQQQYIQQHLPDPNGTIPDDIVNAIRDNHRDMFDSRGQMYPDRFNAPGTPPFTPAPKLPDRQTPPEKLPGPGAGQPVNPNVAAPRNDLSNEIDGQGRQLQSRPVADDGIHEFKPGLDAIKPAQDGFPHWPNNWDAGINNVRTGLAAARDALKGHVSGDATEAMFENLNIALPVLANLSKHTKTLESLVKHFFEAITTTKQNFLQNESAYNDAASKETPDTETINLLNTYAQQYMDKYRGVIDDIASRHPSVDDALQMPGGAGPGPVHPSGVPGRSGGGTGLTPGGVNTGVPAGGAQPAKSGAPSMPRVPADALKGAAAAAQKAGAGAQKALGQAGSAAKALTDTLKGTGKGGGLPEGVLGLGPKGVHGAGKSGGTAGGRAGGGRGVGAGAKAPAKLVAASKIGPAATPVSRAGLSGSGGQGGAGTPAAGHRGGGGDTTHKASKALHTTKNSEELLGDVDAVAAVLGGQPQKAAPKRPEA